MARRRKSKEAPIETLLKAPWWISVGIAVIVIIGLKWVLPSMWASNMFLKPLAGSLSGLAWIFSGVFLIVGLLSFARERMATSKAASTGGNWRPTEPTSVQANQDAASGWQARVDQHSAQRQQANDSHPSDGISRTPSSESLQEAKPIEWSIELLRALEWKRFEDLCQRFYESKGIKSETTPLGPDGGIDIRLYQDDSGKPTSIVQCKAWGERYVGVKPVRELLGVMAHEKIEKAFFMASGQFTDEAKSFAQSNRITLITGEMLVAMIKRLPEAEQLSLLAFATDGDYRTPTCPSCGIKMRRVPGSNGRSDFWGCHNYPRCRQKLGVRSADKQ